MSLSWEKRCITCQIMRHVHQDDCDELEVCDRSWSLQV